MAIPTMSDGVQFRSMLEARWARFFSLLEFPWKYEPFELEGYIPDFIVHAPTAPPGKPAFDGWPVEGLLVEVKGTLDVTALFAHQKKIIESGWCGSGIIVGAHPSVCIWLQSYVFDNLPLFWQTGDTQKYLDRHWKRAQNETQWRGRGTI